MSDARKPKLRWFQFSLRTLFVFVTLCAVACSWLGVRIEQARKQKAAIDALFKLDNSAAWIFYDYQVDGWGSAKPGTPRGPAWLRSLLGDDLFNDVAWVFLQGSGVTDKTLASVRAFPELRTLELYDTNVTDDGLKDLTSLSRIETLSLLNAKVTDKGVAQLHQLAGLKGLGLMRIRITAGELEQIKGLSNLKMLSLSGCDGVTHRCLIQVGSMTQLRELDLDFTGVTDAGLRYLAPLTSLRELNLQFTNVTDDGIKRLQKALPGCKIIAH